MLVSSERFKKKKKVWGGVPFLFPCVPGDHIFSSLHYDAQMARHMMEEPSWNMGKIIEYLFYSLIHAKIFIEHLLCMVLGSGTQFSCSQRSTQSSEGGQPVIK